MNLAYKSQAQFLAIYVREAHATDGVRSEANDKMGIQIAQPKTQGERHSAAVKCQAALQMSMPVLIDSIDDKVGHMYSGMPDRLYVIDRNGKVVYKSARGPFGFKHGEMEQTLILTLIAQEAEKKPVVTHTK